MKRHPALQQLSRDHHRALVAAQRLKRVGDSDAKEARARFLEYWDADELFPLIERTVPETQLVALTERLAPSSSDGGPVAP